MHQSPVSLKMILFAILFSIFVIGIISVSFLYDTRTKIIFCNVGQGDGTYIRVNNKVDIIIDAGPDNGMMLSCLGKYMPFFDKQIEVAILSHPQSDHYGGLRSIIDRYRIQHLYTSDRENSKQSVNQIFQKIIKQNGLLSVIRAGEHITVLNSILYCYWPAPYLVNAKGILSIKNSDDNIYSSVFYFQEQNGSVLFTGDTPSSLLNQIIKHTNVPTSVLKVSHHGSKNGTSRDFVLLANPTLAVISVGKKNTYGHPSKQTLDIFKALKIPVKRTDEDGDIVIRW